MCVAVQGAVTFDSCTFGNNSATDGGGWVGWVEGAGAGRDVWRCRARLCLTCACLITTTRQTEVGGVRGWVGKTHMRVQTHRVSGTGGRRGRAACAAGYLDDCAFYSNSMTRQRWRAGY